MVVLSPKETKQLLLVQARVQRRTLCSLFYIYIDEVKTFPYIHFALHFIWKTEVIAPLISYHLGKQAFFNTHLETE